MGSSAGLDPEDLAHSGLIVLWGTNTLTTNLHLWPFVTAGRERGSPLVVVDPVRTRTAARADLHLAPRPGTDGALALGVMARLVQAGAVDDSYLSRRTLGWPQFRGDVLSTWSPERAALVSGVPAGQIEAFADLVEAHRPLGIRALMGVQRHGGAAQALRLVSCLPAVTGAFAVRGGGLCYSTGSAYGWNEDALRRPDLQPGGPARTLLMSRLGHEMLDGDDPPVRVLVVWAANPVVSNPDTGRVRQGLAREDLFTAVVEHTHTATTAYADLVLPGTMQHEHTDLVESYSHLYVNWNEPAVEPPGECLPHTEIFRRLALALGVTEPAVYAGDEELAAAALDSPTGGSLTGIDVASLRERGWQRLAVPTPYLPFAEGFPTPSGLFEFASRRAEAQGLGLLPDYRAPREAAGVRDRRENGRAEAGPAEAAPLALVSAANHYILNSTFSASRMHTRAGEPTILVHPADAAARGVADGRDVEVSNARGSFTAVLRVSDAVRPGVAATSKGLPPRAGAGVNATTSQELSDAGNGAVFHDNAVWVRPQQVR